MGNLVIKLFSVLLFPELSRPNPNFVAKSLCDKISRNEPARTLIPAQIFWGPVYFSKLTAVQIISQSVTLFSTKSL